MIKVFITRARMLLNKSVFEAEVVCEDMYTVYVGIMEEGWDEKTFECLNFKDMEYYDYLRIYNSAYEALNSDDNEGQSFRCRLPQEKRREAFSLCLPHLKEIFENDNTPLRKGEWNNGDWQLII